MRKKGEIERKKLEHTRKREKKRGKEKKERRRVRKREEERQKREIRRNRERKEREKERKREKRCPGSIIILNFFFFQKYLSHLISIIINLHSIPKRKTKYIGRNA